jgi:uncharacterized membrane protein
MTEKIQRLGIDGGLLIGLAVLQWQKKPPAVKRAMVIYWLIIIALLLIVFLILWLLR